MTVNIVQLGSRWAVWLEDQGIMKLKTHVHTIRITTNLEHTIHSITLISLLPITMAKLKNGGKSWKNHKYAVLLLTSPEFFQYFRNAFKQNGGRIVSVKVVPRSIQHNDRTHPDCSNSQPLELTFAPIQEGKQLEIAYTYSVTFVSRC